MTDDNNLKQDPNSIIDQSEIDLSDAQSQISDSDQQLLDRCRENEEKYKRAIADYRNLEHRMLEERKQYVKLANRGLIESLLEPLDFMETATKHIEDKGLKMVIDRFYQVLNVEGLEEIKCNLGDIFNEQMMEAVDTMEGETGKVMEVRQKGFRLNGVVIRHAKVVVGREK